MQLGPCLARQILFDLHTFVGIFEDLLYDLGGMPLGDAERRIHSDFEGLRVCSGLNCVLAKTSELSSPLENHRDRDLSTLERLSFG